MRSLRLVPLLLAATFLHPARAGAAPPGPAASPPPAAADAPAPLPPRVLLDRGALYVWDRASTDLAPLPLALLPAGGPPLALSDPGDGRGVMVMRRATDPSDRGRRRLEGEALLLAWSARGGTGHGFSVAWTARFEGLPWGAAMAASRAFVVARRWDGGSEAATERAWLHEVDRTSGRLEDSTVLPAPPAGIAADPSGRRVFAALADRILSLTTRPLVTSWHYRSPGANGALAVSPSGKVLAAARGRQVALFDAAAMAALPPGERRDREDDATLVTPLPLEAERLAFSEDGRLLGAFGGGGLAFIETATGAIIWPETAVPLAGAATLHPLGFPGTGRDLIVAAFPAAAVAALPAPPLAGRPDVPAVPTPPAVATGSQPGVMPRPTTTPGPMAAPAPAADIRAAAPRPEPPPEPPPDPQPDRQPDPQPHPPPEGPSTVEAAAATPSPAPEEPVPPPPPGAPPAAPAAGPPEPIPPPEAPPTLSGRILGDRGQVRAVVLYGPDSIIREHGRVRPDAGGTWRAPLPPPGSYRVVAVGDGSNPIRVTPAFLTVAVAAGASVGSLDFSVGAAP